MDFDEVLAVAGLKLPKKEVRFGPFRYERDEFRFWHRFYLRSFCVAMQLNPVHPVLQVNLPPSQILIEGLFLPPQWVYEKYSFLRDSCFPWVYDYFCLLRDLAFPGREDYAADMISGNG